MDAKAGAGRAVRALGALLLALALVAPTSAEARKRGIIDVPDLGPARALANGLYEVLIKTGPPITTHGVDGPDSEEIPLDVGARPPRCASGAHQRVLYGRHFTSADNLVTARMRIETAIWRLNAQLDHAARESGGRHADLRVGCDAAGKVSVDSFVNVGTASFADVVDAARLAGATDEDADYLIFYDDSSPEACGVGSFTDDDRLAADNANNAGGGYAVVYADCWEAATTLHEIGHTMGAVQPKSPHGTGAGHCRDEVDVMCYADGREGAAGMLSRCSAEQFDCGYDDYFDVAPDPDSYLATHWNLGSPLNRFLDFNDLAPGEELISEPVPCHLQPGGCEDVPPDDEFDETPAAPVRILGRSARLRGTRVRVVVACPAERYAGCRGRLELRHHERVIARRRFSVGAGERAKLRLRLSHRGRKAWAAGRLRRLEVVADEPAMPVLAARTLALAGPAR